MSRKQKKNKKYQAEEAVLDFEEAKELTVGQAVRKHAEIKAGVTAEDGLLDRYIKQHRNEIEAEKFETQQSAIPEELSSTEEQVALEENSDEVIVEEQLEDLPIYKVEKTEENIVLPEEAYIEEEEEAPLSLKKQVIIWSSLATVFIGVLVAVFLWLNPTSKTTGTNQSTSSTSASQSSADATAFNTLYANFFVDSEQTKLKNSEFSKLSDLKTELDKLTADKTVYAQAKIKYEALEKAIAAINATNAQFDKPVIVDGVLDTTAQVKDGASLEKATTGITAVDKLIAAAIEQATAQKSGVTVNSSAEVVANSSTASAAVETSTTSTASEAGTTTTSSQTTVTNADLYGISIPAGVTLQRDVSRVPYNQSAIDDASNEAWYFNPGILENIIAISQQRGYITGNQYILEKVNIINGNGYYNLFKPDGSYLFSINAKTGYFVGNGSGNADALDY